MLEKILRKGPFLLETEPFFLLGTEIMNTSDNIEMVTRTKRYNNYPTQTRSKRIPRTSLPNYSTQTRRIAHLGGKSGKLYRK